MKSGFSGANGSIDLGPPVETHSALEMLTDVVKTSVGDRQFWLDCFNVILPA